MDINSLSDSARYFWDQVTEAYDVPPDGRRLLLLACQAWDRSQEAKAVLDSKGVTYVDRFGTPRQRPEVAIERDSRLAFARLMRDLRVQELPDDKITGGNP